MIYLILMRDALASGRGFDENSGQCESMLVGWRGTAFVQENHYD